MTSGEHTKGLLPCPFCGVLPEVFPSGDGGRGTMIECCTSGCVNPHTSYYGVGVAEAHWNTRTAVNTYPYIAELVEALHTILANTEADAIPHIAHDGLTAYQSLAKDISDCAFAALTRFREAQAGGGE